MMLNYIRSESLKHKGKFRVKLLFIAPIITILLSAVLNAAYLQNGAYNWWYILILPSTITIIICFSTASEKKKNRHGMFSIVVKKEKLWLAQVILNSIYLFITVLVFFILISQTAIFIDRKISILQGVYGSIVLFICFAWQIPLWMWFTEKVGAYITLFISVLSNIGISIIFATSDKWWIPFAIPSRLMCPILGIQPNGLWVENGSYLMDSSIVSLGVGISIIMYVITLFATSTWFKHREV